MKNKLLVRIIIILLLSYCMIHSIATVILGDTINDEHMYLAAASLLGEKSIYKDFSYLQSPYMPYFYSIFHRISGFNSIFTSARVFKGVIVSFFILIMYNLLFLLSRNKYVSVMCIVLLVFNDTFLYTIQFCRNYDMALLFAALGLFVSLSPMKINKYVKIFITGLLIGISIGTKFTYALLPLCFILPWFYKHGLSRICFKKTAIFCTGLLLGLLPMVILMGQAGFDVSYYNNVEFHNINTAWRIQTGYSATMNYYNKLKYALGILTSFSTSFIFIILFFNLAMSFFMKNKKNELDCKMKLILFTLISILMFMIPTPVWESYFVTFIISLFLLICYFFPQEEIRKRRLSYGVILGIVMLLIVPNINESINKINACFKPELWSSSRLTLASSAIKMLISKENSDRPIATLTPLYVLEAGFKIYPELSSGPFSFRSGGLLNREQREKYKIISSADLPDLFLRSPPSAILTGFQKEYEKDLVRFAVENGYKGFPIVEGPFDAKRSFGIIYIKLSSQSRKLNSDKKLDLMYKNLRQYLNCDLTYIY